MSQRRYVRQTTDEALRAAQEEAAQLRGTVDDAHAAADAAQRTAMEAHDSAAQAEADAQQRIASELADIQRQVNIAYSGTFSICSAGCLIVNQGALGETLALLALVSGTGCQAGRHRKAS